MGRKGGRKEEEERTDEEEVGQWAIAGRKRGDVCRWRHVEKASHTGWSVGGKHTHTHNSQPHHLTRRSGKNAAAAARFALSFFTRTGSSIETPSGHRDWAVNGHASWIRCCPGVSIPVYTHDDTTT